MTEQPTEALPAPKRPEALPPPEAAAPRRLWLIASILLVLALMLAAWGILSRLHTREELGKQADANAAPVVNITHPSPAPPFEELILPGSMQAFIDAPIYARTSGYLKRWYRDIGSRVHQGDLLAEIDAPDLDQQAMQGEADLHTAEANDALSQTTATRWRELLATDSVSKQDADEKFGDAAAKSALAQSAKANLQRLRELQGFKRIVAPFDGVVTARNTDVGALIVAGGSSGPELFHMAADRRLRVYVSVPQTYAASIKVGMNASLDVPGRAGKLFDAVVAKTADAIDPASRTLLTQLEVDNSKGELFPGAYTQVHFKLPAGGPNTLRVPSNSLLFRPAGISVAVVNPDNHLAMHTIVIGRDFGSQVEVLSGVSSDDRVVVNPPDSAVDDMEVRIAAPKAENGKQGGAPTKPGLGQGDGAGSGRDNGRPDDKPMPAGQKPQGREGAKS